MTDLSVQHLEEPECASTIQAGVPRTSGTPDPDDATGMEFTESGDTFGVSSGEREGPKKREEGGGDNIECAMDTGGETLTAPVSTGSCVIADSAAAATEQCALAGGGARMDGGKSPVEAMEVDAVIEPIPEPISANPVDMESEPKCLPVVEKGPELECDSGSVAEVTGLERDTTRTDEDIATSSQLLSHAPLTEWSPPTSSSTASDAPSTADSAPSTAASEFPEEDEAVSPTNDPVKLSATEETSSDMDESDCADDAPPLKIDESALVQEIGGTTSPEVVVGAQRSIEVAPSVGTVQSSAKDTPPVQNLAEDEPPVQSSPENELPVQSLAEDTPPVQSSPNDKLPVQSSAEDTPPVQSSPNDELPVQSSAEDTPPVQSSPNDKLPVQSSAEDTPPVQSSPNDKLPVQSSAEDTPPVQNSVMDESMVQSCEPPALQSVSMGDDCKVVCPGQRIELTLSPRNEGHSLTPAPATEEGDSPTQGDEEGSLTPTQGDEEGSLTPTQGDEEGSLTPTQGDEGGSITPTQGDEEGSLTPEEGSITLTQGDEEGLTPEEGSSNGRLRTEGVSDSQIQDSEVAGDKEMSTGKAANETDPTPLIEEDHTPKVTDHTPEEEDHTPEETGPTVIEDCTPVDQTPKEVDHTPQVEDNSPQEADPQEADHTPQEADPQKEDNAPQEADHTPQEADHTPQKENKAPQEADHTPQKEDNAPQEANHTPQKEDNAPQEEDNTPQEADHTPQEADPQDAPQEADHTPQEADPQDAPQEADPQDAPQEADHTPQEEDSVPQEADHTPQEEDSVPQEADHTPQEEDSVPQEADYTPQEEDKAPQEADYTPDETAGVTGGLTAKEEVGLTSRPTEDAALTSRPSEEAGLTAAPTEEVGLTSRPTEEAGLISRPTKEAGLTSRPTEEAGITAGVPKEVEEADLTAEETDSAPELAAHGPEDSSAEQTDSATEEHSHKAINIQVIPNSIPKEAVVSVLSKEPPRHDTHSSAPLPPLPFSSSSLIFSSSAPSFWTSNQLTVLSTTTTGATTPAVLTSAMPAFTAVAPTVLNAPSPVITALSPTVGQRQPHVKKLPGGLSPMLSSNLAALFPSYASKFAATRTVSVPFPLSSTDTPPSSRLTSTTHVRVSELTSLTSSSSSSSSSAPGRERGVASIVIEPNLVAGIPPASLLSQSVSAKSATSAADSAVSQANPVSVITHLPVLKKGVASHVIGHEQERIASIPVASKLKVNQAEELHKPSAIQQVPQKAILQAKGQVLTVDLSKFTLPKVYGMQTVPPAQALKGLIGGHMKKEGVDEPVMITKMLNMNTTVTTAGIGSGSGGGGGQSAGGQSPGMWN